MRPLVVVIPRLKSFPKGEHHCFSLLMGEGTYVLPKPRLEMYNHNAVVIMTVAATLTATHTDIRSVLGKSRVPQTKTRPTVPNIAASNPGIRNGLPPRGLTSGPTGFNIRPSTKQQAPKTMATMQVTIATIVLFLTELPFPCSYRLSSPMVFSEARDVIPLVAFTWPYS
jgi:hypothetical protein